MALAGNDFHDIQLERYIETLEALVCEPYEAGRHFHAIHPVCAVLFVLALAAGFIAGRLF